MIMKTYQPVSVDEIIDIEKVGPPVFFAIIIYPINRVP